MVAEYSEKTDLLAARPPKAFRQVKREKNLESSWNVMAVAGIVADSLRRQCEALNSMIIAVQDMNLVFGVNHNAPRLIELAGFDSRSPPRCDPLPTGVKTLQTLIPVFTNDHGAIGRNCKVVWIVEFAWMLTEAAPDIDQLRLRFADVESLDTVVACIDDPQDILRDHETLRAFKHSWRIAGSAPLRHEFSVSVELLDSIAVSVLADIDVSVRIGDRVGDESEFSGDHSGDTTDHFVVDEVTV